MNFLAAVAATTPEASAPGLSINFFWVIVAALNFLFFLALIWMFAFQPISKMLSERKIRIDQGLADAAQAGKDREAAQVERDAVIADARREANALMAAAAQSAQQMREADITATKTELRRMHDKAVADIASERDHALAELRSQVADLALAAAGKVVSESMTEPRQRKLVEEFLRDETASDPRRAN